MIAEDSDKEKANLVTYRKLADAFTKHDAKALAELLADDLVWSEEAEPKDRDEGGDDRRHADRVEGDHRSQARAEERVGGG